jgi:hypothetical protein
MELIRMGTKAMKIAKATNMTKAMDMVKAMNMVRGMNMVTTITTTMEMTMTMEIETKATEREQGQSPRRRLKRLIVGIKVTMKTAVEQGQRIERD